MRSRTRDSQSETYLHTRHTWNNKPSSDSYETMGKTGLLETMTDELHPNYKKRIRNGEVIVGPCDVQRISREYSPCSVTAGSGYSDDWTVTVTGDLSAQIEGRVDRTHTWESQVQSMRDRTLVEAYAKIRDDSIMSGEILSDIGQSLTMLRHPFRSSRSLLKKILKKAKSNYRKTAASIVQANANAWLEYRYGWNPIFLDFRQGFKMFSDSEKRLGRVRKVARSGEAMQFSDTVTFTDMGIPFWNVWNSKASGQVSQSVSTSVHAGVIYGLSGRSRGQQLSEDLRLGADSLASTMWEVIPLSFVADWFIRVGPWIEAVNLPPSVTVLGSWSTYKWDLSFVYKSSDLSWYNPYKGCTEHGSWGGSRRNQTGFSRAGNPSLPSLPPVNYKLPGVLHATDGLALLCNQITGLLGKLSH